MVAEPAPSANKATATATGCGMSSTGTSAAQHSVPPTATMRRLPWRTMSWPTTGKARMTPTDRARITSPMTLFVRSKRSCTHGIWATHEPTIAPLTKNTPVVATRGVTACRLMRASP